MDFRDFTSMALSHNNKHDLSTKSISDKHDSAAQLQADKRNSLLGQVSVYILLLFLDESLHQNAKVENIFTGFTRRFLFLIICL